MKMRFCFILMLFIVETGVGQTGNTNLKKAFQQFENDIQLKHALVSLYVIDGKTGEVVFDRNSQTGLAPASTQKIITSVTAFELLGKDFRYRTDFVLRKEMHSGAWFLFVDGSGDPTFGSWRYVQTAERKIMEDIYDSLGGLKPSTVSVMDRKFGTSSVRDGYIWQDMGNYYGSGTCQLNWKENQYDISFESYATGQRVRIEGINMDTAGYTFINEVIAGEAGSGDNAYIYAAPYSKEIYLRGTIPPQQKSFTISGSNPDPVLSFGRSVEKYLEGRWKPTGAKTGAIVNRASLSRDPLMGQPALGDGDTIYTHYSPPLDSIIYWLNKKSINLYGEALLNTLGDDGSGKRDAGVKRLRAFWEQKGLDEEELNIVDGSGLSPGNRVTTHAQVEVLKYAQSKAWYPSFYNALPEYNGMKMKSGTINGVKAFCGYQKAADGHEYIFSFLVNNYSGTASSLVGKMYKVLDVLK
jgi:serine-type D-Ala-D-Ala carboxypeptidase/endopeptidase (penicillin-binding protein 4)